MAVAAINNALVHGGILSIDDIDLALRTAEASITADERMYEDMARPTGTLSVLLSAVPAGFQPGSV
ncbi:hypothetical protein [Mesorhizobium loti]|uniref:hypothetical protein n=1 Tax=Rhizobium loti TaxID=381 RepID=UPI001FDA67F4|nr:hypothetical protein [Mesorhizobium loti]